MPLNIATAPDSPEYLPIAIAGHQYLIDPSGYRRESVPNIRTQADTSFEPGEQSLNPQGLWRRSQDSWNHGAGNVFLDGRKGLSVYSQVIADPERFRASKGIDIWTKGQMSLLNDTTEVWSSTNTNLAIAIAGVSGSLYIADGTDLWFSDYPVNLVASADLDWGVVGGAGSTGAWIAGTNTTVTAATYTSSGEGPDFGAAYSLRLSAASTSFPSIHLPTGRAGIPVIAGREYQLNIITNWFGAGDPGAGRLWNLYLDWYQADGAVSAVTATDTTVTTTTDLVAAMHGLTATAPADAAFVSIRLEVAFDTANAEFHFLRSVSLFPTSSGAVGTSAFWRRANINGSDTAATVNSITSNGSYVWAALGLSGIHRATGGAVTSTINVPGPVAGTHFTHLVGWANGRLLAAGSPTAGPVGQRNVLYEITDPLGTPAFVTYAGWTHPDPNFVWTFISPGRNCIYVGGNSGSNGEVYRITLEQTGVALSALTHATYLPDGETVLCLQFYAGGIVMGTSKGLRLGQADAQGNIDYGPLVATSWPVRCIEPQDRYVWFGMSRYDDTSGGLGRIDLGFFTDALVPAWASDLMTATQNDVTSVATWTPAFQGISGAASFRLFTVSGVGVFAEDLGATVASGTLETGAIRFSTSETKMTRVVDVRHHVLAGTIGADLKMDDGPYLSIGSSTDPGSNGTSLLTASAEGESAELRFTLNRNPVDLTGPQLTRWTLKALPLPRTDETFTLPILLKSEIENGLGDGSTYYQDVAAETAFLIDLESTGTVFELQVGGETLACRIDTKQQVGERWSHDRQCMEGVMLLRLQTVEGAAVIVPPPAPIALAGTTGATTSAKATFFIPGAIALAGTTTARSTVSGALSGRVQLSGSTTGRATASAAALVGGATANYGWLLTTSNTGLAGVGVNRNTLPEYGGSYANNETISMVKISVPVNVSTKSGITFDRVYFVPNADLGLVLGSNMTVKDCDMNMAGAAGAAEQKMILSGTGGYPANSGTITIQRCHITGTSVGMWLDGGTTTVVEDCYIHAASGGSAHHDGITRRDGTGQLTIRRCRIAMDGGSTTGAIFLQNWPGGRPPIRGVLIQDSLLEGNGYNLTLESWSPGLTSVGVSNVRCAPTEYGPLTDQATSGIVPTYTTWANVTTYSSSANAINGTSPTTVNHS